jgi:3-hydroxybutyryl-CoA dehydrogenase
VSRIKTVGVLGCGQMGSGIAQVTAVAGFDVIARDLQADLLARGRKTIEQSLGKFVEKGKLDAGARDAALGRLTFTTDLKDLAGCELVIEAVTEDLELKNRQWTALDLICPPTTVFASNTSSLSIMAMATVTGRPDRFLGLHFFNPVPMMPLVEVVRTVATSAEVLEEATGFVRRLGKEPIAAKDSAGFIVNLLLIPYLLDAVRAVERGVASVPDIDTGMKLGCGHPMGPLTLLDFVGLDTAMKVGEILYEEFREARYAPPPLLKRMVLAGWYGKKSGKGFYDWGVNPPAPTELGL